MNSEEMLYEETTEEVLTESEATAVTQAMILQTVQALHQSVRMSVWAYAALVTIAVTAFVVALFAALVSNNTGQAVGFALVSVVALALFVASRPWRNQAETAAVLRELVEDLKKDKETGRQGEEER